MDQGETKDIQDVQTVEKRRGRSNKPLDPEAERKIKKAQRAAVKAIKEKDARALTEQLKLADVQENSPEWKRAWKAFYGSS